METFSFRSAALNVSTGTGFFRSSRALSVTFVSRKSEQRQRDRWSFRFSKGGPFFFFLDDLVHVLIELFGNSLINSTGYDCRYKCCFLKFTNWNLRLFIRFSFDEQIQESESCTIFWKIGWKLRNSQNWNWQVWFKVPMIKTELFKKEKNPNNFETLQLTLYHLDYQYFYIIDTQ